MNLLETTHQVDEELLAAAAAEKDRRIRAQAFKDPADPDAGWSGRVHLKRNDAIQLFVKLYRTPHGQAKSLPAQRMHGMRYR